MLLFFKKFFSPSTEIVSYNVSNQAPNPYGIVAPSIANHPSANNVEIYAAEHVGGKGFNLLKLRRSGVNVPSFFIVPTAEFDRLLLKAEEKCGHTFKSWLLSDTHPDVATKLVDTMMGIDLSEETVAQIKAFTSTPNTAYAVRSSANVEDGKDSAFAGQFITSLNVTGVEDVCRAVKQSFVSILSDTVKPYYTENQIMSPKMAVVIMEQIDSQVSGVYFQANPLSGSSTTHVINSTYGQGEGLVGGLVASDEFWIDSSTGVVKKTIIGEKKTKISLAKEGTEEVPVEGDRQSKASCSGEMLSKLYEASKKIQKAYGSPQDVEFAFSSDGTLYIVQARPITTYLEELKWEVKDVGLWRLNSHIPVPMSAMYNPIWCETWAQGAAYNGKVTGSGFQKCDTVSVNGFGYFCLRFPGPKEPPTKPLPKWLMRLILKLTGKEDTKAAMAFWNGGALKVLEEFQATGKQKWIDDNLKLQSEDLSKKSDEEMVDYLSRAYKHAWESYLAHVKLTLHGMLPAAYFVEKCVEWVKCPRNEAEALLEGDSPVTEGIVGEFAQELSIIRTNPALVAYLNEKIANTQDGFARVEKIKQQQKEPGYAELNKIITHIEFRLSGGYDPILPTLGENPTMMLTFIKHAVNSKPKPLKGNADAVAFRARIPPQHHAEFDRLYREGKMGSKHRDERAVYTDLWSMGILRAAMKECAKRISLRTNDVKKQAKIAELMLEGSLDEFKQVLSSKQPVSDELLSTFAKRKNHREHLSVRDAPELIGGVDIGHLLTPQHFPNEYLARSFTVTMAAVRGIQTPAGFEEKYETLQQALSESKTTLFGLGASVGVAQARALVVRHFEDVDAIQQGDIVIVESPSSLINLILPFAAGIVTDFGANLSHAAICAREHKIPCVIGVKIGTKTIKTGQIVKVDGTNGRVDIIEDVKGA